MVWKNDLFNNESKVKETPCSLEFLILWQSLLRPVLVRQEI